MVKSLRRKIDLAALVAEQLAEAVPPHARLVVGVSGGADSVALLHALAADPGSRGRLLAVHVNHGLRGSQADRDERFVVRMCTRLGVACKVFSPDVSSAAVAQKWSWEEAGRKLRQKCFLQAAREFRARAVVMAHHRDDQAETVLFNFLRGTALRGLGGMLPVRTFPHPEAPAALKLVRPLLGVSKAELLAYCRAHRLAWRLDATNHDTAFIRNRIRHRLLPYLEKNFNPGLRLVLARSAESAARDEVWLEACAQKSLCACAPVWGLARVALDRRRLAALAEPLRFRVLALLWDRLGIPGKSQAHLADLAQAVAPGGSPAGHLPGKWRVRVGADLLEIFLPPEPKPGKAGSGLNRDLLVGVHSEPVSLPVKARRVPAGSSFIYVDAEKIRGALSCRVRRPGETLQVLGLSGGHKHIKKILSEMGIPPAQRAGWPLVVMRKEVIWVYRGPMSESVKLDAKSRRAIKLTLTFKPA
ncbi:MAG: tRNA lysidine(34) synthetase TilS [Candidatus Firestonebacteria bacterium]|nr:tRNA lysidine(34) synthetase TilS [Candidatus Firestonebacteria bacterium]